MALGLGLLLLFDFLVKQLRMAIFHFLNKQLDKQVVEEVLERVFVMSLKNATHERMRGFSELVNAIGTANHALANIFLITSLDMVFSVVVVSIMLFMDPVMASVAIAPILPMALLSLLYVPRLKKKQQEQEQRQRRYRLKLGEAMDDAETVKSLDADASFKQDVRDQFREDMLAQGDSGKSASTLLGNLQGSLSMIGMLVLLYVGAHRVLDGHISFGVYIAINMLSRNVLTSCQKLFDSVIQAQQSRSVVQRLQETYETITVEPGKKTAHYSGQASG